MEFGRLSKPCYTYFVYQTNLSLAMLVRNLGQISTLKYASSYVIFSNEMDLSFHVFEFIKNTRVIPTHFVRFKNKDS